MEKHIEKMQSKIRVHADPCVLNKLADGPDQFDRIPDALVLLILNKVADVQTLGRCLAVSKRFNSLVALVHDVSVKIDQVVDVDGDENDALNPSSPKPRNLFSNLLTVMIFTLFKPLHNLCNPIGPNKPLFPQLSHHSPAQVLKTFINIRNLRIELPSGDVGMEEGVFLKWRAEFGSTLQNCVIFGGMRVDSALAVRETVEDNEIIPESFYTNGGLKLRVVWTISSLIAASTRHYLLRLIIKDHPTLESLVLTDADGQGTLVMGAEQLKEYREKPLVASASSKRTQVPASNMKLRYASYLDLPNGTGIQGATLVAIRPSSESSIVSSNSRNEAEAFVCGAFDGPLRAAVKALTKRRAYLLEMNGF